MSHKFESSLDVTGSEGLSVSKLKLIPIYTKLLHGSLSGLSEMIR